MYVSNPRIQLQEGGSTCIYMYVLHASVKAVLEVEECVRPTHTSKYVEDVKKLKY